MTHDCSKKEVIEIMREDVKEIKGDVKTLLSSKYKIDGSILTMQFVISIGVTLIAAWFSK
jgi:hypothetical protein